MVECLKSNALWGYVKVVVKVVVAVETPKAKPEMRRWSVVLS